MILLNLNLTYRFSLMF